MFALESQGTNTEKEVNTSSRKKEAEILILLPPSPGNSPHCSFPHFPLINLNVLR